MHRYKVPLTVPEIQGDELKNIQIAMEQGMFATSGDYINKFEDLVASYLRNDSFVAALNSGTSCLHLALVLAGIEKGDEVLCQSFTFSASANPIMYQGAIPVFVDSERDTWNLCPVLLETAIKDRIANSKKPKAMVVVHAYGRPAKTKEILRIAEKYNILLIEDAAAALGSKYFDKTCGTMGDFGVVSFNGNKIITTSAGGVLITKDKKIKKQAVSLATQARELKPHYEYNEVGYNYRMTNIAAAIGVSQMQLLDERLKERKRIYETYKSELRRVAGISFVNEIEEVSSNHWMSCVLCSSKEHREYIRLFLEERGIESRPVWKPLHEQKVYAEYPSYVNGNSIWLFERGLILPSGPNLTLDDQMFVIETIKNTKPCSV